MISWMFNILGLLVSWYLADLDSLSVTQNTFFPILVAVFLMVLLTKVASFLGLTGRSVDGGGGDFKGPDGDGGGD
jgi:hypothetical protein